jgi:hypothetical protein
MRHAAWDFFAKNIKDCPLENLINNQSFMQTMFSSQFENIEFEYLKREYDLDTLYSLIWEPVESMPESNNIHQLYHLTRFINYAGKDVFSNITEFGAGYGSLCVRIKRLLKPEVYNIIDLPELQELQKRYLKINHEKVDHFDDLSGLENGKTFIALWSLSETPIELRNEYLGRLDYKNYFFAFGSSFFDVQNFEFFNEFRLRRPNIKWYSEKIEFMNDQYYLMGKS